MKIGKLAQRRVVEQRPLDGELLEGGENGFGSPARDLDFDPVGEIGEQARTLPELAVDAGGFLQIGERRVVPAQAQLDPAEELLGVGEWWWRAC